MEGLNDKEKKILKFLFRYRIPFPVNHIARAVTMSWVTVQQYLEGMENEGYVIREERFGKEVWRLNFEKYRDLKRRYKI